ncbi:hypothetical protein HW532_20995 [Kaustia mangrovi]|uniref:Uncharacterized protein n=1 Tax=Kaustia mangrovi TaxID=2593653 RepID=A0A7S8C7P2_9HYPH|nr:hypothetical protein [Kaustia mangrovi]QPC44958.1 hypothetical protein HW532_20995 [Kaustia mangrovi]
MNRTCINVHNVRVTYDREGITVFDTKSGRVVNASPDILKRHKCIATYVHALCNSSSHDSAVASLNLIDAAVEQANHMRAAYAA